MSERLLEVAKQLAEAEMPPDEFNLRIHARDLRTIIKRLLEHIERMTSEKR